jgi:hypothetical protein
VDEPDSDTELVELRRELVELLTPASRWPGMTASDAARVLGHRLAGLASYVDTARAEQAQRATSIDATRTAVLDLIDALPTAIERQAVAGIVHATYHPTPWLVLDHSRRPGPTNEERETHASTSTAGVEVPLGGRLPGHEPRITTTASIPEPASRSHLA